MKLTSVEKQVKREAKRSARQAISSLIKENRRNKRASEEDRLARKKNREPRKWVENVQPVVKKRTPDQLRQDRYKSEAKLALQHPKSGRTLRREQERKFTKQTKAVQKAAKKVREAEQK